MERVRCFRFTEKIDHNHIWSNYRHEYFRWFNQTSRVSPRIYCRLVFIGIFNKKNFLLRTRKIILYDFKKAFISMIQIQSSISTIDWKKIIIILIDRRPIHVKKNGTLKNLLHYLLNVLLPFEKVEVEYLDYHRYTGKKRKKSDARQSLFRKLFFAPIWWFRTKAMVWKRSIKIVCPYWWSSRW